MDVRLPTPKNWQDFETICHLLWKEIWNDPNAQKNGRQGQPQNGVDIFGTPIYTEQIAGVQCKDKDEWLASKLKKTDIMVECEKTKKFLPQISSFTIASTSPRDSIIQEVARKLTVEKKYPFSVQIWSWDDIQEEILCRPLLYKRFYENYALSIKEQRKIKLQRYSSKEQLQAYFSRPIVKNMIPNQLEDILTSLVYELSDNAYKHGNATEFGITVDANKIVFKDNGIEFNPITDLRSEFASVDSHVGSLVFEKFKEKYNKIIALDYCREKYNNQKYNCLKLEVIGDLKELKNRNSIEITINLNDAVSRNSARSKAALLEVPRDVKEIILVITNYNIAMSFSVEFIKEILSRMDRNQKLTINVPRDFMFDIKALFDDERLKVVHR